MCGAKYLQGSWAGPINDFISGYAPDPRRPATKQFDPQGSLEPWIHANSASLPVLPYYNTWGDERIAVQHCFFFWCSTGPDTSYGDVVLQPGTDVPTQDTAGGGERFLPTGYTGQSWQWNAAEDSPEPRVLVSRHVPIVKAGRDRAWILRKRVTLPGPMTVMRRLDHRAPEPVRAMTGRRHGLTC